MPKTKDPDRKQRSMVRNARIAQRLLSKVESGDIDSKSATKMLLNRLRSSRGDQESADILTNSKGKKHHAIGARRDVSKEII